MSRPDTQDDRRPGRRIGNEREVAPRLAVLDEVLRDESARHEELVRKATLAVAAVQAASETTDGLEPGLRLRRENVVTVREPLVLICQAQRSGGTLLARLFDGHPQCHAHPHELHIGVRRPHQWPDLSLDEQPDKWFAKLREERLVHLFKTGKRRVPLKGARTGREGVYPFMLPPPFQRLLFLDEVERRSPIRTERQVLDCYMTSLFNAWLDNQHLRGAEKRWVVAFSPRRAWGDGLERFFSIYPDGRLVSIVRDPRSWFTSAQGRDPEAEAEGLLELWKRSVREMLEADRRFREQVRVIRFDELVLDTAGTMLRLADWLGIDFDDRLVTPTFNGYPVGPNSSYEHRETGVVTEPVERYKELLTDEQQELIRVECGELYSEALALTERRP